MRGTMFRPGPTLGLSRFYPAPRPMPVQRSMASSVPRKRMAQGPLCCQNAPNNRVICSNGYSYSAG